MGLEFGFYVNRLRWALHVGCFEWLGCCGLDFGVELFHIFLRVNLFELTFEVRYCVWLCSDGLKRFVGA